MFAAVATPAASGQRCDLPADGDLEIHPTMADFIRSMSNIVEELANGPRTCRTG